MASSSQILLQRLAQNKAAAALAAQSAKTVAPAYVVKWNDIIKYQVRQGRPGAGTWINTETTYADYYLDRAVSMWSRDAYRGDYHSESLSTNTLTQLVGISGDTIVFRGILRKILISMWPNGPMNLFNSRKEYNESIQNLPPSSGYRTYYGIETTPSMDVNLPNDGDLDFMSMLLIEQFIYYMQNTYPGVDWD